MMEITIAREAPSENAVMGIVSIDGGPWCFSLERQDVMIPCGRYRMVFTVSGRAQKRMLWCPAQDLVPLPSPSLWMLPELLDVPGRTSIRLHALNTIEQTEGCIGLGLSRTGSMLGESRKAIRHFMEITRPALADCWVTLMDAA